MDVHSFDAPPRFDVAIIGGGVIGCSTAHFNFIKTLAPEAAVAVIEPDRDYELASTTSRRGRRWRGRPT